MTDENTQQPTDLSDLPEDCFGETNATDFDDAPSASPAKPVSKPVAAAPVAPVPESLEEEINLAMAPAVAAGVAAGQMPHQWSPLDYVASGNFAASAAKLADSAVAPLVAAARGYETIDEETLAEASKRFGLPRKTTAQGKRIAEAVTRGDLLVMPWFTADDISMAAMSLREAKHTTIQFRPARPDVETLASGKTRERKYEFVGGQKTPIGVHPSFDGEWINKAPVVLLAEGLLKGDSAITALLLHAGYTPTDLGFDGEGGTPAARKRLSALLNTIPESERVLILTIGGVDNWKNNNEWRDLELRNRQVWVGVDGDVASNPNVFRSCTELWDFLTEKKKTRPSLIAPTVQGSEGEKKIGIDDFLSKYGNWADLVLMLSPRLPAAPPSNDLENVGNHRISDDGTTLEVCEPIYTDAFNPDVATGGKWKDVLGLGGRILSTVAQRTPTGEEIKTGVLGAGANNDDADANCEIEIAWKDDQGTIQRHVISGPASILNYGPDQWDRNKAHVPAPILRNPDWPPPRKISEDWLRAIKANRAGDTAVRVRWDSMGWVPVEGTVPAFVVGDQVIGADDAPDIDILAGVTEAELAGANRFGVGDEPDGDFDDDDYRDQVRDDIELVIETFIYSGAWTDRKVASTVVAAALRPTLPIRPHTTCFLVGPPSKGKALPLDARIPVPVSAKFPTGWARNADLAVGDAVYAPDGTLTSVLFLSDVIDDMDMYEFTLADGQKVTSTASHMWKVSTKQSRSGYQRGKHASGREKRRVEAARLRDLAAGFSNGDGVSLPDMAATFGISYGVLWSLVRRSGIPSETLVDVYGDPEAPAHRKVTLYPVGETLLALADHVETGKGTIMPVEKVMTAAEIEDIPRAHAPAIHLGSAIDTGDVDLPIPAYTLGAWLGDGTSREAGFTCFDPEILVQIKEDGFDVTSWAAEGHGTITGLSPLLRAQGLLNNKHIPAAYLRASAAQRLALLQGLMDTDGTISEDQGQAEYVSVSLPLAVSALELVRSLGVKAKLISGPATITETDPVTGEKTRREVGLRHRVRFTSTLDCFRLTRKAMRVREEVSSEVTRLGILHVERLAPVPSRCIQVEHETGMFLADGFVPTHNSWTAAMMMGFWSRNPGDFSTSSLPGSAKDTAASIELAVARSPIWVVDDLAPASSRQQSEQEQSKIADLVRNIFNGSGKRRSNADMGSRKVHTPRALLVVTAENELQVPSARDRCVTLNIGWGALAKSSDPTNRVSEVCAEDGAPARVTQAVIRFLRAEAKRNPEGWRGLYELADGFLKKSQEDAATRMKKRGAKPGDLKRHADLAGDLAVSLHWLRRVAQEVGCRSEILDLLTNDGMIGDVYDLVAMGHKANQGATQGRALVEAVASALFRKKAHILDAVDASRAPGGPNVAPMLGWEIGAEGTSRPKGDTIGWLVTNKDTGEQHVLLDQKAAFSIAQKEHPDLVPHGQGSRSSWNSVVGEGLVDDDLRRAGNTPGSKLNTARLRPGSTNLSGVPMPLAVLLARGDRESLEQSLDDK